MKPTTTLFCDYIYNYVENIRYTIQQTTYDGYMHILDKHIYPYFKQLKLTLSKLTTLDVENYYKSKLQEKLSPNTIIKHHQLIHSCLNNAVRLGTLKENVADKAVKPKKTRTETSFYTSDELLELFRVVKNTSLELPVFFAVLYGLRRSEVLGLKWSAIDFEKMTITINNKVVRCHNENGSLVDIADSTLKSDMSYRILPMNADICRYLKQFPHINEYICTDKNGNRLKTDYITHKFYDIIRQNNLKPVRFHDLRHSCASLLILTGFNMKEVQEWLGHSDYTTTIPVPNSNTKPVAVPTEIIMLFNSDLMRLHTRDRYFSFFMTPKR